VRRGSDAVDLSEEVTRIVPYNLLDTGHMKSKCV
jgi:hypothetical protein